MTHRRTRVLTVPAAVLLLLVAGAYRFSPLWPGPSLPPGGTRLHLATDGPHLIPTFACPVALLAPARVTTVGDELVLQSEPGGLRLDVVFPSGWAAWQVDGQVELVSRDGDVIASEGDLLDDLGGGMGVDDAFHVCVIGG